MTSDLGVRMDGVAVTTVVTFWVHGLPKPQGSKKAFVIPNTRRAVVTEQAGMPLKTWRQDVKMWAQASMAGRPPIAQPAGIRMHVQFVMPRPKSLPKTRATPLLVKTPDLDKLMRAVGDALTGTVYADDSQIVALYLEKRTAEIDEHTGAQITVERLDQ